MPAPSAAPFTETQLYAGILAGERPVLAKAITLIESTRQEDRLKADRLLKQLLPHTGQSIRIGVTGVPGAGKSSFIEVFGELLTAQGKKVAVLAIDPTSQKSKGSILGDKTRMEQLSRNPHVFIRPTPTGTALGGVSYHTREAILLCEAAGFDVIVIETVGVGQSETVVRGMVDFFLLLLLSGAGDELQGMKKGIMEMADGVVINKSDGDNIKPSMQAKADAQGALHLQAPPASGWSPKVLTISAMENKGIDETWKMIQDFHQHVHTSGYFKELRSHQKKQWLEESIDQLFRELVHTPRLREEKDRLTQQVMKDSLLPTEAAQEFWEALKKHFHK